MKLSPKEREEILEKKLTLDHLISDIRKLEKIERIYSDYLDDINDDDFNADRKLADRLGEIM